MGHLREAWRAFRRDPPGHRFERRNQRLNRGRRGIAGRVLRVLLGVLLLAVGLVFLPLPGPGFIPLLLAAALLAGESRRVASMLDRTEVRVRRWLR